MKKYWPLALILLVVTGTSFVLLHGLESGPAPAQSDDKINWLTIEELNEMAQRSDWDKKKRKIFIDLYTDWCGWCKKMDKTTFRDPRIVAYINEHYYAVKFDAETKETVRFGDKEYEWVSGGRNGINELTRALGVTGFPSYAFLTEDLAKIQVVPGYHKVPTMLPMLVYFNEDQHKETPWEKYKENFDMQQYSN